MDFIRIEFEKGSGMYVYRDCLTLPKQQYETLTEEDIEAMKEQRYQQWLSVVMPPSEEVQE